MGGAQQRWLVLALLAALPVLAQSTTFDDDFESGTILKTDVPPGHWDTITPGAQIGSVAVTGLAAHRGGHGLRMIDLQGGGTGELAGYHLTYFYSPAPANLYLRTWMRVISSNSYHSHLMGLGGSRSFCSVNLEEPGNTFYLEGELGSYLFTSANVSASTGQWHLIEVAAHGVGTASGGLRLWIDGVARVVADAGSAWQLDALEDFRIGALTAEGRWMGTIDYDDVRSSLSPMASQLAVTASAGPYMTGSCVPLSVSFRDSVDGGLAPAPYALLVDVSQSDGGGSFFADPACLTAGLLFFDGGMTSAQGAWRPSASGSDKLIAAHLDFLPASIVVAVIDPPDAGPPDSGVDAGPGDAGPGDAGPVDAGPGDAGPVDAGPGDAGPVDAGPVDAGPVDAGPGDAGPGDAGPVDAGRVDAGSSDPRQLAVGCGCGATGSGGWWLICLLGMALRVLSTSKLRAPSSRGHR